MRYLRRFSFLTPTLVALAALAAGDAPPLVDLEMPSLARTVERLEASPWGALYNDPAMAPMREQVTKALANASSEAEIDVKAALLTVTNMRLRVDSVAMSKQPYAPPIPTMIAQATFGTMMKSAWEMVQAKAAGKPAATVAGADAAIQLESDPAMTLARFKDTLVFGSGMPLKPIAAGSETADMALRLDIKKYVKIIKDMADKNKPGMSISVVHDSAIMAAMMPQSGTLRFTSRINAEGFLERYEQDTALKGNAPVDRALLAKLPADTMMMIAGGYDGALLWKSMSPAMLTAMAALMSKSSGETVTADMVVAQGDAALKQMGVSVGVQELISSFKGTVAIVVSPSVPYPAVSVIIPRSTGIDQLVAFGLAQMGVQQTNPTTPVAVPLPGQGMPDIHVAASATHWMVSMNELLVADWIAGKKGGFLDGKAAKAGLARAPADACVLGVSDTPTVLKTLANLLSAVPVIDGQTKPMLIQGLGILGKKAGYGSMWAQVTSSGGMVMETQGLVGISSLFAGGFLFGFGLAMH